MEGHANPDEGTHREAEGLSAVLCAAQQAIDALRKLRNAYEENGNNHYCKNVLDYEKTIECQRTAICEVEKEGA